MHILSVLLFPGSAEAHIWRGGNLNSFLIASCIKNIPVKDCYNLIVTEGQWQALFQSFFKRIYKKNNIKHKKNQNSHNV